MAGTLILPLDDSSVGASSLAAAVRALSSWNSSLLIVAPPGYEFALEGFEGADVSSETLPSAEPEALIERVQQAPPPVTLVLSFEAAAQDSWLGAMTRELLQRKPAALLLADPSESPRAGRRTHQDASAPRSAPPRGLRRVAMQMLQRRTATV
jgi:hypothetical protein